MITEEEEKKRPSPFPFPSRSPSIHPPVPIYLLVDRSPRPANRDSRTPISVIYHTPPRPPECVRKRGFVTPPFLSFPSPPILLPSQPARQTRQTDMPSRSRRNHPSPPLPLSLFISLPFPSRHLRAADRSSATGPWLAPDRSRSFMRSLSARMRAASVPSSGCATSRNQGCWSACLAVMRCAGS